jgi:hypothetical protein
MIINLLGILRSKLTIRTNFYIGKHDNKKDNAKNNRNDEKPPALRGNLKSRVIHISILSVKVPGLLLCSSHY